MNPFEQARMTALNTPMHSPLGQIAMAVCQVRMIDPYAISMGAGMPNWQAIILETALLHMMLP